MALTRPDILAVVNISGEVVASAFQLVHVRTINKEVSQARIFAHLGLSFPPPEHRLCTSSHTQMYPSPRTNMGFRN